MTRKALRRWRFMLERWVQRGVFPQMLLIASLIALVAVLGGVAAWAMTPTFDHLPTAIWWSFLRLTDPGYLGDDEGTALRFVSTVVTVLGYVLFMGSLIAIMTQWLARTIRKLESGLTPIAMEHHFVILGWTNRTPEIVKKLLSAGGRMERFLAARGGSGRLRVVILADEVDAERRLELKESLGNDWNESRVFLRSGSSLQREHLARLDLPRAAVVIIPGADFALGGADLTDTRVVKTLLNLDALFRQGMDGTSVPPRLVAELFDPRKIPIAHNSIGAKTEVIAGDQLICRVLSRSLKHAGVGKVLLGLLSHGEGNTVFVRAFPELAGESLRSLVAAFPEAVVLGGVLERNGAQAVHLDMARDARLQAGDSLVLIAESYAKCYLDPEHRFLTDLPAPKPLVPRANAARRRLLILGWSSKIPTLLSELSESNTDSFDVTILSRVAEQDRERTLSHLHLGGRLRVAHAEGDYSLEHDLRAVAPQTFDDVLFMASAWMKSSEEADARTVLGLLLLRSLLPEHAPGPEILVELLDPNNARLLGETGEAVFVSPLMLSHLLAHVGLRPELNGVFDELVSSRGASLDLRPLRDLGLDEPNTTFAEVQLAAMACGATALGFFIAAGPGKHGVVCLNPTRDRAWHMRDGDLVIVLLAPASAPALTG